MMNCPKCKSHDTRKDGKVKAKQRFYCKKCHYHFTVKKKSTASSARIKKNALELYLEGLGFRAIGRFLKVSHVSVYQWIKNFGEKLAPLQSDNHIKVVELEELHLYVGQKKKNDCWLWIAVNRDGKKFINCVLGSCGTETGKKLWNLINDKTIDKVATDYWSPYENFIPSNKHIHSPKETFR